MENYLIGRKDRANRNFTRKPSKWAFIIMQGNQPLYATLYHDSATSIMTSLAIPNARIVRLENKACKYIVFFGEKPAKWAKSYKELCNLHGLGPCNARKTLRIMTRSEANEVVFKGDGPKTLNRPLEKYERAHAH